MQLEASSYQPILSRYDRPTTFFYCDPPYVGIKAYQHNFDDEQFEQLAIALRRLKGRFLLSINDCDQARRWFAAWPCREISFVYTSTRRVRPFRELIFSNYTLPSQPAALTPDLPEKGHEEPASIAAHTYVA